MKKKTNKPLTHVAIVLDKSGSMSRTKKQAIEGYNEQIQQFKENAKDQDIRVSLVTFNGNVFEHLWEEPAEKLTEATEEDYVPNGSTALRTAVGYTIQKYLDTTDTEDENAAYLLIVISDGENTENGPYSKEALKEMISTVQKTGRWTITYLGCSEDYLNQLAWETGVAASNMAAWDNSNARSTTLGLKLCADKAKGYFDMRKSGLTSSCTYMNNELGKVADFSQETATNDNHLSNAGQAGGYVPQSTSAPVSVPGVLPPISQLADTIEQAKNPKPTSSWVNTGFMHSTNHHDNMLASLGQTPPPKSQMSLSVRQQDLVDAMSGDLQDTAEAKEASPKTVADLRFATRYTVGDTRQTGKSVFGASKPVNFTS
jgi:uncharacterized protein YegL